MRVTRWTCDGCGAELAADKVALLALSDLQGEVCSLRCAKKWIELKWVQLRGIPPIEER